jgi:hypothetical protein
VRKHRRIGTAEDGDPPGAGTPGGSLVELATVPIVWPCAMACWISLYSTVGTPNSLSPPSGLGIFTLRTGRGPVGALVERQSDSRPASAKPRPQLSRGHPVHSWCPLVLLDALQRLHQVLPGEHLLPEPIDARGLSLSTSRRRMTTTLCRGFRGILPLLLPPGPLPRVGCDRRDPLEPDLGSARLMFGPSRLLDPRRYYGLC